MREKPTTTAQQHKVSGITPAYAGKTPIAAPMPMIDWDHPRVCGKNVKALTTLINDEGSPPRMREKQQNQR